MGTTSTIFLLLSFTLAISVAAGRSLPTAAAVPKPNATEQFLSGHNQARAAVSVAALSWSANLSGLASRYARHQRDQKSCGFADLGSSPYGANQGWTSYPASPAEVVASWVDEGRYYFHTNNSCAAGHECGTYTQVVWRKTEEVGCAQASCNTKNNEATITICLYYPHGNVQGEIPY